MLTDRQDPISLDRPQHPRKGGQSRFSSLCADDLILPPIWKKWKFQFQRCQVGIGKITCASHPFRTKHSRATQGSILLCIPPRDVTPLCYQKAIEIGHSSNPVDRKSVLELQATLHYTTSHPRRALAYACVVSDKDTLFTYIFDTHLLREFIHLIAVNLPSWLAMQSSRC